MDLNLIGWDKYAKLTALEKADFDVGRVSIENKTNFTVLTKYGECSGILRGKTLKGFDGQGFPKVGDWVRVTKLPNEQKVVIEEILPRVTKISRKSPDDEIEQVIVANIDVVFIVQALPDDYNLRRLERYLVIARQSGAKPVVVLNKIDLKQDYLDLVTETKSVAQDVEVVPVSAKTGRGIDQLKEFLKAGMTFVFLGSSGVGKSSMVNAIVGTEKQTTREIRDYDSRGRHTTTKREMIVLEDGSILIDTPGMREVSLWADENELENAFADIEELALQCRFGKCDHEKSAGCAIKAALEAGRLDPARYRNYIKMVREAEYLESKTSKSKETERRLNAKKLSKKINKTLKDKYP